jgi:hypothetical protein
MARPKGERRSVVPGGVFIDKERLVSSVRKKDELVGIINGSRS